MEKFPIGIIGGTGGIGRWFAAFFEKEGHTVHVSGRDTGLRPAQMAEACPVVIVSVPIGVTEAVIREMGPHMKKDSLLMDLTSLKAGPVRAMLEASASEVIGLHPLFGPGVPVPGGAECRALPGQGLKMASLGAGHPREKRRDTHRDNAGASRRDHGRRPGAESPEHARPGPFDP